MEPYRDRKVPILVLTNQLDEFSLQNIGEYQGLQFVNIETTHEEVKDEEIEENKN